MLIVTVIVIGAASQKTGVIRMKCNCGANAITMMHDSF
jgi:hypothetical protein